MADMKLKSRPNGSSLSQRDRHPSGRPVARLQLVRQQHAAGSNGSDDRRGRLVVSIDRIVEDPKNERKTFRNMEGLIESVKRLGVIEPLLCTAQVGGHYMLHIGHRRLRAAKAAGLKTVEIIVRDPDDEWTRRVKSVASNVQRENVGAMEMAEALQALLDEHDKLKTQRELAKAVGVDETWISGMLGLFRLPMPLQKKLETSQVFVPYDAAIKVSRLKDSDQQTELIGQLVQGATVRDIRAKITAARRGKEPVMREIPPTAEKHLDEPAKLIDTFDDEEIRPFTIDRIFFNPGQWLIELSQREGGRWAQRHFAAIGKLVIGRQKEGEWTGRHATRQEAAAEAMDAIGDFLRKVGPQQNGKALKQASQLMMALTRLEESWSHAPKPQSPAADEEEKDSKVCRPHELNPPGAHDYVLPVRDGLIVVVRSKQELDGPEIAQACIDAATVAKKKLR